MRNPRPCEMCREPEQEHQCFAHPYRPAKRTESLRARRITLYLGEFVLTREQAQRAAEAYLERDYGQTIVYGDAQ